MRSDTKLGQGMCAILHISGTGTQCTYMLDQTWHPSVRAQQQPHYQPIKKFTYWPLLDYFNNENIIQLSHKETSSEDIEKLIKLYWASSRFWRSILVHGPQFWPI